MLTDNDLSDYYAANENVYNKCLEDIKWDLDQFMKNASDEVKVHFNTSRIAQRVKPLQSFIRKCRREQIAAKEDINLKIEDILGIRISTANKEGARELFGFLQQKSDSSSWFCELASELRFVPYTIEDKNNYSLKSGYQAFHITFACKKNYPAATELSTWPVEIQIMSRLWDFWAEYSREYFYGREGSPASAYLPYNVAISKILDSADDLVTITIDRIRQEVAEDKMPVQGETIVLEEVTPEPGTEQQTSLEAVKEWFDNDALKHFQNARIPGNFFLSKIAEELSVYGITLDKLPEVLEDQKIDQRYRVILGRSSLHYLPPHEQILTKILLHLGRDEKAVIDEVNQELRRLGTVLYPATLG